MSKKCLIDQGVLMSLIGAFCDLINREGKADQPNLLEIKKHAIAVCQNPIDLDEHIILPIKHNGLSVNTVGYFAGIVEKENGQTEIDNRVVRVQDLPQELKDQLQSIKPENNLSREIMDIVEASMCPFSLDQMHVAYYRNYGKVINRSKLRTCLNNLVRSKKLHKFGNNYEK